MKVTFKQPNQRGWFIGEYKRTQGLERVLVWLWWRPLQPRDLPFFVLDRLRSFRKFGSLRYWFVPLSLREKLDGWSR